MTRQISVALVTVAMLGVVSLSSHKKSDDDIFVLTSHTTDGRVSVEDSYTTRAAALFCSLHPADPACHTDLRPDAATWLLVSPSLLHGVPKRLLGSLADAIAPPVRAAELTTTSALVLPVQSHTGDFTSPAVTLAPNVVTYGASFQFSAAQMAAQGWGMTMWVEESSDNFVNDIRLECGQTLEGPLPQGALVFFHCTNSGTGNPLRGRVVTCEQPSLFFNKPLTCTPTAIEVGVTIESQS